MRTLGQQTEITDPALLATYPRIAPAKTRQVDMLPGSHTLSTSVYVDDAGDPRKGNGRAVRCNVCGTVLRTGQPHSSRNPEPHQSLDMMTVVEPEDFEARNEEAAEARLEAKRDERRGLPYYGRTR